MLWVFGSSVAQISHDRNPIRRVVTQLCDKNCVYSDQRAVLGQVDLCHKHCCIVLCLGSVVIKQWSGVYYILCQHALGCKAHS